MIWSIRKDWGSEQEDIAASDDKSDSQHLAEDLAAKEPTSSHNCHRYSWIVSEYLEYSYCFLGMVAVLVVLGIDAI